MGGGITALLAISRFSYATGTSGTVVVPAGAVLVAFSAVSVAGGSMTISPGGANQPTPSAGASIPLPAGVPFSREWAPGLSPLGSGTTLTFTSTDSYYVEYATSKVG